MRTVALFFSLLFEGIYFRLIHKVISRIIGVPMLPISANPFTEVLEPPTLEQLWEFFHAHPQGEKRANAHIKIDIFSPLHRLVTKIIQHNLFSTIRKSELILKRAQFLYAIIMWLPFCICKHILNCMIEMKVDASTRLPFACLITEIIHPSELDVSKMRIQAPLGNQTHMKLNAQLRHEGQDEAPQPPPI
jgi:hypothetical protein